MKSARDRPRVFVDRLMTFLENSGLTCPLCPLDSQRAHTLKGIKSAKFSQGPSSSNRFSAVLSDFQWFSIIFKHRWKRTSDSIDYRLYWNASADPHLDAVPRAVQLKWRHLPPNAADTLTDLHCPIAVSDRRFLANAAQMPLSTSVSAECRPFSPHSSVSISIRIEQFKLKSKVKSRRMKIKKVKTV